MGIIDAHWDTPKSTPLDDLKRVSARALSHLDYDPPKAELYLNSNQCIAAFRAHVLDPRTDTARIFITDGLEGCRRVDEFLRSL